MAPGLSPSVEVGFGWQHKDGAGVLRYACDPSGKLSFTPLFVLKVIKKRTFLWREGEVKSRGALTETKEYVPPDEISSLFH